MASFKKRLQQFLHSAVSNKVIDQKTAVDLQSFYQSDAHQQKAWLNLSHATASLGAFVLVLGISLLVATNWYTFSDLGKLILFLFALGFSHVLGIILHTRAYKGASQAFHFIGSGLFIVGIGLIAQIFHLDSETGISFLIWSLMILPLAIIIPQGSILLMATMAFMIWANIGLDHYWNFKFIEFTLLNTLLILCFTLIGNILVCKKIQIGRHLLIPGVACLVGLLYALGFAHNLPKFTFNLIHSGLFLPIFTLNITLLTYQWSQKPDKQQTLWLACLSCVMIPCLFMLLFNFESLSDKSLQYMAFGRLRTIYFIPALISLSAWLAYFAISAWGVVYGAFNEKRWLLNLSLFLFGLGIFTRFLDLVGSMMDTGMVFIVMGILLFVIAFLLERWRSRLVQRASKGHYHVS